MKKLGLGDKGAKKNDDEGSVAMSRSQVAAVASDDDGEEDATKRMDEWVFGLSLLKTLICC